MRFKKIRGGPSLSQLFIKHILELELQPCGHQKPVLRKPIIPSGKKKSDSKLAKNSGSEAPTFWAPILPPDQIPIFSPEPVILAPVVREQLRELSQHPLFNFQQRLDTDL